MGNRTPLAGLLAICSICMATPVMAHHSGAMFDRSKTVVLKGAIKEYQFTNPHTWIEIMVPDETGKPVQWSIEGETPGSMNRIGLTRSSISPGDQVTLKVHPLRDGRTGGSYIELTTADGRVMKPAPRAPDPAPTTGG
jgi:hypothetical protein